MADVDDLLARLAHGLARGAADGLPLPDRLCRAAVSTLGCDGGAITIAYTQVDRVTLCTTDDTERANRTCEVEDLGRSARSPGQLKIVEALWLSPAYFLGL